MPNKLTKELRDQVKQNIVNLCNNMTKFMQTNISAINLLNLLNKRIDILEQENMELRARLADEQRAKLRVIERDTPAT